MAITGTEILQLQVGVDKLFQDVENRDTDYGVFEKLWDGRKSLYGALATPEGMKTLDPEASITSAKLASFENKGDDAGTARASGHAGSSLSSTTQTITWATVTQGFGISKKDADSNFFKEEAQLAQGFLTARQICLKQMTDAALAFLEANKSGVSAVTSYPINNVSFDGTNDIHNVANGGKDLFFSILQTIMKANNYGNFGIDFIHDYNIMQLANDYFHQGSGNDVNKQYQISPNFSYASTLISAPALSAGVGYMFPKGAVAAISAIPKMNRRGDRGDNQIWGSIADKVYPELTWGVNVREVAQDGSINQDLHKYVELSLDYSFGKAKLSATDETVIQKVALLNA